jgi:hypothetical protein
VLDKLHFELTDATRRGLIGSAALILLRPLLLLAPLLQSCFPASARHITLTITSEPSGATVTWNDRVVGTTPYSAKYSGGYFHQTTWVTSKVLRTAVNVVLSKPGYKPQHRRAV